jgi:hypothetical protein
MKRVVLVAPQFPPCNLAAVHRNRFLATHLPTFGWQPHVLTVDPGCYEESLDWELARLVPDSVRVTRVQALPTRPLRTVGDIAIRALPWLAAGLERLVRTERPSLICLSIPPNYSAILGPLFRRLHGIRYVVDYQDPWVHPWPGSEVRFSKAWWALQLGRVLERPVLRHASLLTGAGEGYYGAALQRAPWLDPRTCVAAPIGAEAGDFALLDEHPRRPTLFDPGDGMKHIVYAGALLPRAVSTLRALLESVRCVSGPVRLHFIGTGGAVQPIADQMGLNRTVVEHPARIGYLHVLNHLKHAHAVLVLGSDEPHYTPSKVYQAVLARRPVIGLLHHQSSGADVLRRANAGPLVTFNADRPASTQSAAIADALKCATSQSSYAPEQVDWSALDAYSAEAMTRRIAAGFDAAAVR